MVYIFCILKMVAYISEYGNNIDLYTLNVNYMNDLCLNKAFFF